MLTSTSEVSAVAAVPLSSCREGLRTPIFLVNSQAHYQLWYPTMERRFSRISEGSMPSSVERLRVELSWHKHVVYSHAPSPTGLTLRVFCCLNESFR
jgi:hypothetical protein